MTVQAGDLLFTYGTLQTAAGHPLGDRLRQHARLVGTGSIAARLYVVHEVDAKGDNWFPAALPTFDQGSRLFGELYELDEPGAIMPALDAFENCGPEWPEPNEFILRRVSVNLEGGGAAEAWCYLYTYDVSAARFIPSGRFEEVAPEVR